ncbi:hypothetical protein CP532_0747 [Ophiocordyceps camponoti-leonardi (nom. inval.)]|nr:hypothetical protein CP532_0747 [Ophiocordyceps camponoti-leonardi (nom. inval.)]
MIAKCLSEIREGRRNSDVLRVPGEPMGSRKKSGVHHPQFSGQLPSGPSSSGCSRSRKRSLDCDLFKKTNPKAEAELKRGLEKAYKAAPPSVRARVEEIATKIRPPPRASTAGTTRPRNWAASLIGWAYKQLVNAFGVPFPDLSDSEESYEWGKWYGELVTWVKKIQSSDDKAYTKYLARICGDLETEFNRRYGEFQLVLDSKNLTKLQESCARYSGDVSLYVQQLYHDVGVDLDNRVGEIELALQSGDFKNLMTQVYEKQRWPSTACKQTADTKMSCADGKTPSQLLADLNACLSKPDVEWIHKRGRCASTLPDKEASRKLLEAYQARGWPPTMCSGDGQGQTCEGGRSPSEVLADFTICESRRDMAWKHKQERCGEKTSDENALVQLRAIAREQNWSSTTCYTDLEGDAVECAAGKSPSQLLSDFKTCQGRPSDMKWKLERGRCAAKMTGEEALAALDEVYRKRGFDEAPCSGSDTSALCGRDRKPDEFLADIWICEAQSSMGWRYEERKCEAKGGKGSRKMVRRGLGR